MLKGIALSFAHDAARAPLVWFSREAVKKFPVLLNTIATAINEGLSSWTLKFEGPKTRDHYMKLSAFASIPKSKKAGLVTSREKERYVAVGIYHKPSELIKNLSARCQNLAASALGEACSS